MKISPMKNKKSKKVNIDNQAILNKQARKCQSKKDSILLRERQASKAHKLSDNL